MFVLSALLHGVGMIERSNNHGLQLGGLLLRAAHPYVPEGRATAGVVWLVKRVFLQLVLQFLRVDETRWKYFLPFFLPLLEFFMTLLSQRQLLHRKHRLVLHLLNSLELQNLLQLPKLLLEPLLLLQ